MSLNTSVAQVDFGRLTSGTKAFQFVTYDIERSSAPTAYPFSGVRSVAVIMTSYQ